MRSNETVLVSIIIPCRNEEKFIKKCLASVLAFDAPPGVNVEVLVLDGLSDDRTREIVEELSAADGRVRLVLNPGVIQSCAMNLGVRESRGKWVMRLDAHAEYPIDYLTECYTTAMRTGAANVGGLCITKPGGDSYEAELVQALTTHRFGVGNSGFRTGVEEGARDTVPFGFFRREIFGAIGYFDERLVRAQDYEFNRRIIASGRTVWLNPAIESFYFNQPTLRAFYSKQFVKEAPYNAYLWYIAPYAFAPRHAITGVFTLGVLGGAGFSLLSSWVAYAFGAVMGLYFALAIISGFQQARRYGRSRHALVLPGCFFLFHFIHGLGLIAGLARLVTGTAPVSRKNEPWPGAGRFRSWQKPADKLP